MIKIENEEVMGWEHAIRGMRNPKNSWAESDSKTCEETTCCDCRYCEDDDYFSYDYAIGDKDLRLMQTLADAGTDHGKFLRMITVYLDITAPLYWWKEYDTYKVGTVASSCSTMHKIHAKEFTIDDFSTEHLKDCESVGIEEFFEFKCGRRYTPMDSLKDTIEMLNFWRDIYNRKQSKSAWYQMIQLLPSSYNQKRTVMLNYAVLRNMYHARKNHKLDEWREFCKWIEALPYRELITGTART